MNQVFNIKRFLRYANYNIRISQKMLLLVFGGFTAALFLVELLIFKNNLSWTENNWASLFFVSYAIAGLLIIGNSFPFLRKRDKTLVNFVLPVSTTEKYLYELVFKVGIFTLLFLLAFSIISDIAMEFAKFLNRDRLARFADSGNPINILPFKFEYLLLKGEEYLFEFLLWAFGLGFSLAFAGSVAFRKFPLIKTIILLGIIVLLIIGYFYLSFEKMDLKYGVQYVTKAIIPDYESAIKWGFSLIGVSIVTALTYSFFKLKEREV
ncbi:hypothetical protein OAA06_01575 [bacterium]|nr:hypothetical protein [bacterium]